MNQPIEGATQHLGNALQVLQFALDGGTADEDVEGLVRAGMHRIRLAMGHIDVVLGAARSFEPADDGDEPAGYALASLARSRLL